MTSMGTRDEDEVLESREQSREHSVGTGVVSLSCELEGVEDASDVFQPTKIRVRGYQRKRVEDNAR